MYVVPAQKASCCAASATPPAAPQSHPAWCRPTRAVPDRACHRARHRALAPRCGRRCRACCRARTGRRGGRQQGSALHPQCRGWQRQALRRTSPLPLEPRGKWTVGDSSNDGTRVLVIAEAQRLPRGASRRAPRHRNRSHGDACAEQVSSPAICRSRSLAAARVPVREHGMHHGPAPARTLDGSIPQPPAVHSHPR